MSRCGQHRQGAGAAATAPDCRELNQTVRHRERPNQIRSAAFGAKKREMQSDNQKLPAVTCLLAHPFELVRC